MKNLIQAAVVTLFAASTAQAQQAVQWKVSDGGNGHWYQWIHQLSGVSWAMARDACLDDGGHLATPTSMAENQFVFGLTLPTSLWPYRFGPWLGGYQDLAAADFSEPAGGWRWVTGEAWAWTAWWPGEPTNFYCVTSGEDKLHYIDYQPMWNDITNLAGDCEQPNWSYIVEWSADCNGDGNVDYGQCHDGTLPDYNSNNIPDCCERGEACVVGNYPVQWRIEDGGNGHWYQLLIRANGIDWVGARSIADAAGGRLAQIESASERQFLFDFSAMSTSAWNKDAGGALGPWLGALQQTDAQEPFDGWIWTDGSPVDFEACHFVASYPSGCGTNEDRMSFWCPDTASLVVGSTAFETSDFPGAGLCGRLGPIRACLIEWSADCNNDGIVDYGQIVQGQLADLNTDGVPDICQQPTCQDADLFANGLVNGADLGILLSEWGPANPSTVSDITRDGVVDGADLGLLLSFWGACP
jgi:hypothetical protein